MSKLTLEQANRIAAAALGCARSKAYKPMAVVVLDDSGNVKAVQREDGATMFRVEIATGKAWASVAMSASSRLLSQRAADNPNFFGALASTGQGRFIPQPGAVLIKDANGGILGAVGASGGTGDEDEDICMQGVIAAGLLHG